ncbi:MAG TPA: hypothetical protein VFH39_04210, partial [Candidatus Saccharimonadales bacterium]|nr:hypothetical protein [Candidatus Saccharimonadales bacterium]
MNLRTPLRTGAFTLALSTLLASSMLSIASAQTATPIVYPPMPPDPTVLKMTILKGDQQISMRLNTIKKQTANVAGFKHVTGPLKTALTTQLSDAQNGNPKLKLLGLVNLQKKLDKETSVTAAQADYNSIFTDYRIYMLVVPKIAIVNVAEMQQDRETNQNKAIGILDTYVRAYNGSDKAVLELRLANDNSQLLKAVVTTQTVENVVLQLNAQDYNNDHTVMKDNLTKLQANIKTLNTIRKDLKDLQNTLSQKKA